MNDKEQAYYADLIMGMRNRGMEVQDSSNPPENAAAEKLYGQKYGAIRADFSKRLHAKFEQSNNFSVQDRPP